MEDFLSRTREELKEYENSLQNDIQLFNSKLKSIGKNLSDYIDQQMKYLKRIESEYNEELNYLYEENSKTSADNQQEFDKLCLSINQNDHDQRIVSRLLKDFREKFPLRPKMFESIPEYHFQDIQIDHLITKQNSSISSTTENHLSSSLIRKASDHSFIPIDRSSVNSTKSPLLPSSSIGCSYHLKLATQNNEKKMEDQSRVVSSCSRMSEDEKMVDIIFQIPYEHPRIPHLMAFNEDENCLLIYPLSSSQQFEYLSINTRQFYSINIPFEEKILNLDYSRMSHQFYLTTRQTNRFLFFRLNEKEKEIEIEQQIELIDKKDRFINVHLFEDYIFFLYLTSTSILMFGKYHLETSSKISSISFENKLYDYDERCSYIILDFTVNSNFISFLTQSKNIEKNKSKIILYDYQTIKKIYSFHLIDSIRPISIISTLKISQSTPTTTFDDQLELLYINDPHSRLVHCCTTQEYLFPVQVSHFGICSFNDGNLAIITKRDIRLLNVQDYLKRNKQ